MSKYVDTYVMQIYAFRYFCMMLKTSYPYLPRGVAGRMVLNNGISHV